MGNIFVRPSFSDASLNQRASMFYTAVWSNFAAISIVAVAAALIQPAQIHSVSIPIETFIALVSLFFLELNRRGWTTVACWLYIISLLAFVTYRALFLGGIHSPVVSMYYVFALMAGVLLGVEAGTAVAFACVGLTLGLVILEMKGALPAQTLHYSALTIWLISSLYMSVVVFLLRLARKNLKETNNRLRNELAERKKAEQHLEIALDAGAVGIWEGDLSSYFVAGPRTFSLFGMTGPPGGAISMEAWAKLLHPEDAPRVKEAVRGLLESRTPMATEYRIIRPDGVIRHVEATAAPTKCEGDVHYVGTLRDLTEQRLLEERFRHSQKMEAMGTLAGGIAHDFNNLLGIIQGFAKFLEDDAAPDSSERDFARRIGGACQRGRNIVKQILFFARHGAQQHEVIELARFVSDYQEILSKAVSEPTRLEISLPDKPLWVSTNAGQLSQLMANLCKNASESMSARAGWIRLGISSSTVADIATTVASPYTYLTGTPQDGLRYACICVQDRGIGIPSAVLKQIFDPFFTTKDKKGGTGLGLAVVHSVVQSHGGFCCVASPPGKGTTISVYLPAVENAQSSEKQERPRAPAAGDERILIVDDEPDLTYSLSLSLGRLGYRVVAINDPTEALEMIRKDPYWDAIIADQLMPGMNGLELIREFKSVNRNGLAILYSGYSNDLSQQDREVVDLQLDKPVLAGELAGRIRRLLDIRRQPKGPL
jgi:PAS domain S-box-containing protein